jgi:hypothetical protein
MLHLPPQPLTRPYALARTATLQFLRLFPLPTHRSPLPFDTLFMSPHQGRLLPLRPQPLLLLSAHHIPRVYPQYLYPTLFLSLPRRMDCSKFILRGCPVGSHRDGVSHQRHGDLPLQHQVPCQFSPHSSAPHQSPSVNLYRSAHDCSALSDCDLVALYLRLQPKDHPRVVTLTGRRGVAQHHVAGV